ncbi:MAG: phospholipid carrier-dependent glycosyltransferase, partial [Clostridia bacterium]|nr:phospholipid carrier-dependent glycosyltransferase [Clostridia bacterium]
ITAESRSLRLRECGFFESADASAPIPIVSVVSSSLSENGGTNLFDEQDLVALRPGFRNSMYFDEIYHARTAYESANGLSIYEWTHPPLGKDMISWCVSLMGMTPFAWRFAGTLAGVLMLPVLYFLGLMMFRKTSWAAVLTSLMALDGMHFVQTRIATIDSFGVLWILVMFLFMYWYYSISFYDMPLRKTFLPLGLCGVAFGLGAASKWICLYAGAGLAVLFFMTLFRRYSEYRVAKANLDPVKGEKKEYLQHICDTFTPSACKTLLFCILFFIVIPLGIYCLSYYPYWNVTGESRPWYQIVLDNQSAMYNYHSNLQATHPYQSDWYTWPVIYRPMYFYSGKQLSGDLMGCISCFGNPVIWYMGLVSALACIVLYVRRVWKAPASLLSRPAKGALALFSAGDGDLPDRAERDTRTLLFLLVGLATNLMPWIGVSRCVFIYHYFASVPFIMLMTVYLLRHICRKKPTAGVTLTILFLVLALALFFLFKPVWSGTEVSRDYVNTYLKWFSSWEFGSGRRTGIVDGSAFFTWLRELLHIG